jgi:hypothetical protein
MNTFMRSNNTLSSATALQTAPITAVKPGDLVSSLSNGLVSSSVYQNSAYQNSASSLRDIYIAPNFYDVYGDTLAGAGQPLPVKYGLGNNRWEIENTVGGSDKVDMIKFSPNGSMIGTSLHITLSGNARMRLIRDANGNNQIDDGEVISDVIASNNGLDATIDHQSLPISKYYIEVSNYGNVSSDYKLNVSYEGLNDLLGKEFNITGATIAQGIVNNYNSSDNYHFNLSSSQNFHLNLRNLTGTADFRVVRDANNNGLVDNGEIIFAAYNQGSTDQSVSLMRRQLEAGSYFLQVNQSNVFNATGQYDIMMGCDWFSNNISDDGILTSARAAYLGDNQISHTEMRDILRSAQDQFIVDGTELNDLRLIVNQGSGLGISKATQVLANKVLNGNGNWANIKSGLGNFGAGSSDVHLENLVQKWFVGSDRPGLPATVMSNISPIDGFPIKVPTVNPATYQRAEGELFQFGISYWDVEQGAVGDCYFLASLGAVARQSPDRIQNMFTDNNDGSFTVRFFVDGQENYVTVDRFLPTNPNGTFVYANNSSGLTYQDSRNELWVALAEKAYAQLNQEAPGLILPLPGLGNIGQDGSNTYQGIAGGFANQALNHITGLNTSIRLLNLFTISQMVTDFNQGRMVVLGTDEPDNPDVAGRHAYTLVSYDANTGYFGLYNPWGDNLNLPSDRDPSGQYPIVYKTASELLEDFERWSAIV